jgi:hypothetical protein
MKQVELTEQILRLYVGRFFGNGEDKVEIIGNIRLGLDDSWGIEQMLPHLRRLSSITEEEAREFWGVSNDKPYQACASGLFEGPFHKNAVEWFEAFYTKWGPRETSYTAAEFLYLTGKGFDLFGLIEAGLAKEVSE